MPPPRPVPPRRGFFRSLIGGADSFLEEMGGIEQLRLDDLPALPDDKLRQLIPAVRDDVRLGYAGDHVVARAGDRPPRPLFRADSEDMRFLACFDGSRSLGEIAESIDGSAFERVKGCFLRLVKAGVCVPANVPD